MARENPLPSHETFVPPENPIGDAAQDWARGFRERTLHPLETLAGKAKELSSASPQELLPKMLGVGMIAGAGAEMSTLMGLKLKLAKALQTAGKSDQEIHSMTGWHFGAADKKPRFEISDALAKMAIEGIHKPGATLGSVLEHPELYKAYPHLKDLPLHGLPDDFPAVGMRDSKGIHLKTAGRPESEVRSTLLHEIQHAVQGAEGHAGGGSPISVKKSEEYATEMHKTWTKLMDEGWPVGIAKAKAEEDAGQSIYGRLAGEVEARATQQRRYLTAEERSKYHPVSSYDVPVEKQITTFNKKTAKLVE